MITLFRIVSKGQQIPKAVTRLPQESAIFPGQLLMLCLQESQKPKQTPLAADIQTKLMRTPLKIPLSPRWSMASLMALTSPKSGWALIQLERMTRKQSKGQMVIWMARPARLPIAPFTSRKCFSSSCLTCELGSPWDRKRERLRWISSFTVKTPMFEGIVLSRKY